jgi:hypothetical protein
VKTSWTRTGIGKSSDHHEERRHPQQEVGQVGEHGDDRQDLGGEEHLLDEVSARDQDTRGLGQRRLEPRPWQDAAEEEEQVRLDVGGAAAGQDHGEHEAVGQELEQRVDEAPEEPQHAAAVAGLQLTRDEALDQQTIAKQRAQAGEHRGLFFTRWARSEKSPELQPRFFFATARRVIAFT